MYSPPVLPSILFHINLEQYYPIDMKCSAKSIPLTNDHLALLASSLGTLALHMTKSDVSRIVRSHQRAQYSQTLLWKTYVQHDSRISLDAVHKAIQGVLLNLATILYVLSPLSHCTLSNASL